MFRQFLTQQDIARDFMDIHKPEELRAVCVLSTLKQESGSFVEDDLRHYFSDVLYSLKTTGRGFTRKIGNSRIRYNKTNTCRHRGNFFAAVNLTTAKSFISEVR